MPSEIAHISTLSDDELLTEIKRSAAGERAATAELIALLAEIDERRLYLGEGCSSLFTYCTQVLRLSEHAAYGRIAAARLARRIPGVLEALRNGNVTLTSVCLIGPYLTPANCSELLAALRHKSKREVEQLVAELAPKPDVPASVRKVPVRAVVDRRADSNLLPTPGTAPVVSPGIQAEMSIACAPAAEPRPDSAAGLVPAMSPAVTPCAPARSAVITPLTPERYKIQFTASREAHDKLRRAQDLLRHTIPDGDVAAVIDRALTLLVEDLERRKLAVATRPRPPQSLTSESRYIPAAVKRTVWARDGEQCTFIGTQGRCTERGFLEFHHLVPFAAGGETSADNLALRCRAHNQYEAEQFFGPLFAREAGADYWIEQLGPDQALPLPTQQTEAVHSRSGEAHHLGTRRSVHIRPNTRSLRRSSPLTGSRSRRPVRRAPGIWPALSRARSARGGAALGAAVPARGAVVPHRSGSVRSEGFASVGR